MVPCSFYFRYLLLREEKQIRYVGKKAPVWKIPWRRMDIVEVVLQMEMIGLIRGALMATEGGTLTRGTMRRWNMNLEGVQTTRKIIIRGALLRRKIVIRGAHRTRTDLAEGILMIEMITHGNVTNLADRLSIIPKFSQFLFKLFN